MSDREQKLEALVLAMVAYLEPVHEGRAEFDAMFEESWLETAHARLADVTDDQIHALRAESVARGDYVTTHACNLALWGESDVEPSVLRGASRSWTPTEARAECARVIGLAEESR